MRRTVVAGALLAIGLGAPAVRPPASAQGRLERVRELACTFTTMTRSGWTDRRLQGEPAAARLTLSFTAIDADDGTALSGDAFGRSPITARLAGDALHFMQSMREGALYVTTVFARESGDGRLTAVHSRHELTEVALPGFTSTPEQYYGSCAAMP